MISASQPENSNSDTSKKSSSEKYFSDLEKWLHDAYMWQGVAASFPYFLMCNQYMSQFSINNNNQTSFQNTFLINGTGHGNIGFQQQRERPTTLEQGIECKVPALWKRLLAEFLDFVILFILKLAITFIAIDFFEIIDLTQFDLDSLQLDLKKMDYKVALEMTHNIMILEVVHRIVVCFFETFFLIGGLPGRIGGSTPGKVMLGLRVVRCESVTTLSEAEETVVVYPGTELDFGCAFARSFIKNLVLALFIPFIAAFYYFPYNRAGYDMICNTIVIEGPIMPHRRHQQ